MMLNRFRQFFCWLLVPVWLSASAAEDTFIAGIADLPLMAGLSEDTGSALMFDKPDGRIVEAYASGPVSRQAVTDFYRATLPQLGWRHQDNLEFTREGEILRIAFTEHDGTAVVRFTLSPR